jgi:hypothetical protein
MVTRGTAHHRHYSMPRALSLLGRIIGRLPRRRGLAIIVITQGRHLKRPASPIPQAWPSIARRVRRHHSLSTASGTANDRPSGDRVLTSANPQRHLSFASKQTAAVGNDESGRAVGSGHSRLRLNKHRRHLCARQLFCRGASSNAKHRGRSICWDRRASDRQLGRIADLAIPKSRIYRSARRAAHLDRHQETGRASGRCERNDAAGQAAQRRVWTNRPGRCGNDRKWWR